MFGFVSKNKYELSQKVIKELELDISRYDKKLNAKQEIINKLQQNNAKYEEIIMNYDKEINILKNECDKKELQRRKSSGKLGNCKRKLNIALKEKKEMMELINNIISERQKILKLKKKPTLDEMRKYFKKNY